MRYAGLAVFVCGFALVVYFHHRMRRARLSDYHAIDDLMKARGLRAISVTRNDNYWRYWLRGRMFSLSNCARIYVIVGESSRGPRREIHVAFDDWPPASGELQTLEEREMPPHGGQASKSFSHIND